MAIKPTKSIWMDGKLVKWKDAKVHIATHALLYGSAVFEGIHSYKTDDGVSIFRLDEHLERLFFSANAFGIKIRFTKTQLKNAIKKIIKINKLGDAYIRPFAYYGYGAIGVYPQDTQTNAAIIAVALKDFDLKSLRVMTSKYVKHPENSTVFGAKISGNYANSILAMQEARQKGYDEALMLDNQDFVAEGPSENLFIADKGNLITPNSRSTLHGITKDSIIEISKELGINVYGKNIILNDVKNADEAFFCGTSRQIASIVSVDNKKIGDGKAGKITRRIRDEFFSVARGRNKKYKKWLTYVD